MSTRPDITTFDDIKTVVDSFYERVNRDDLLGPIFNDVANVEWSTHLPTMYRFWEAMLLGGDSYQGAPFPKHAGLPVQQQHFERWLTLFVRTVDAHFEGPKSEEAKARAISIADTFARRIGVLKNPFSFARAGSGRARV